jgi:hypothetical protein
MYPSVAVEFAKVNDQIEGVIRWPYLDVKGLVTCAIGYLVDDRTGNAPEAMLALPWKHVDGSMASRSEIATAWQTVKSRQDLKELGGGNSAFANLTDIRLDDAGIQEAYQGWVSAAEPHLRKYFPSYDRMPADAQLAILLMAYAMGSAFSPGYPHFTSAINAVVPDYNEAAAQSHISTVGNPGIVPRDADIVTCLQNAARAQADGSVPYSVLWFPDTTPPTGGSSGGGGGIGARFGQFLMGGVLALFAWTGYQAYINRDAIAQYQRKLLR